MENFDSVKNVAARRADRGGNILFTSPEPNGVTSALEDYIILHVARADSKVSMIVRDISVRYI